mmetsp:Transcript_516/g.1527  ORF Transcript_516/g.1527 Transcript_516/m.1527 type:complete len:280 (+) Transcript_516:678-1517(+)
MAQRAPRALREQLRRTPCDVMSVGREREKKEFQVTVAAQGSWAGQGAAGADSLAAARPDSFAGTAAWGTRHAAAAHPAVPGLVGTPRAAAVHSPAAGLARAAWPAPAARSPAAHQPLAAVAAGDRTFGAAARRAAVARAAAGWGRQADNQAEACLGHRVALRHSRAAWAVGLLVGTVLEGIAHQADSFGTPGTPLVGPDRGPVAVVVVAAAAVAAEGAAWVRRGSWAAGLGRVRPPWDAGSRHGRDHQTERGEVGLPLGWARRAAGAGRSAERSGDPTP